MLGEDSTPSSAHQVTTMTLVVVVGVVVRIRRLLQVAAMQPPGERIARGAASDQDPAERRPGGEAGRREEEVPARTRGRRQADAVKRRHGPDGVRDPTGGSVPEKRRLRPPARR